MPELQLPPAMSALRRELGVMVEGVESRAAYGAVLLSAQQGLQIQIDDREERVVESPPSAGTVVTAFDGVTLHERAISGFARSSVERGAHDLVKGLKPAAHASIDPGPDRRGDFSTPISVLSTAEKLDRCRDLQQRLRRSDARITNARVRYLDATEYAVFRNRTADLAQSVQRLYLIAMVMVAGPDGVRYDVAAKHATGDWAALVFSDDELQKLTENAIALTRAERIEPGEYTIITAPGVTGTICHESFGHGVETDMFLKERARAAHYIDRVVGAPLVSIYDDPSLLNGYGFYFFDDEGLPAGPTQIVENGIFRRGITDLYSAMALGLPRSANGRRSDYSRKAYARMSNTFFASGTTPVADLFAQVESGVYLEKWSSGMEDPQGWGIQVTCHFGHEIKQGRVTSRMFAPIGITGNVPDVLQTVSAVGNDFAHDAGYCGKGHKEMLPVGSGGPHLLLKARLG